VSRWSARSLAELPASSLAALCSCCCCSGGCGGGCCSGCGCCSDGIAQLRWPADAVTVQPSDSPLHVRNPDGTMFQKLASADESMGYMQCIEYRGLSNVHIHIQPHLSFLMRVASMCATASAVNSSCCCGRALRAALATAMADGEVSLQPRSLHDSAAVLNNGNRTKACRYTDYCCEFLKNRSEL